MEDNNKPRVLIIIPAKLNSERLPLKNLRTIDGKTLIEITLEYAQKCTYPKVIIISTDSDFVGDSLMPNMPKETIKGTYVLVRDTQKYGKDPEVVDTYLEVVDSFKDSGGRYVQAFDYVIGLQPDHPDREHSLDTLLDYFIENKYDDLITIEENYKRSGSVRIFKWEHLKEGKVSRRIGTYKDSATDIHYIEDLNKARSNYGEIR